MQTDPTLTDELFDRYLAGHCTEQERHTVERLLAERPGDAWLVATIRQAGVSAHISDPVAVYHRALARVRDVVHRGSEAVPERLTRQTPPRGVLRVPASPGDLRYADAVSPRGQRLWYTAAGVALGALMLMVGWQFRGMLSAPHRPVTAATYATGNGERATITLHDGSTVSLGVASRLEVPADYPAGDHTIRLTGEAMFTVTHHTGRPFTVLSGGAAARVLGTSFLVRHYTTDTSTTIAVRDGKVAVHTGTARPMVVTAAQQATVLPAGGVTLQRADPAQFTFTSGVLTLNGVSLRDAIVELDRWYDTDIRLGDPALGNRHVVQGEFSAGSLSDLTNLLELTFDVHVVRNGRVLTLFPR